MNEYLIKFTTYSGTTGTKSLGIYTGATAQEAVANFQSEMEEVTVKIDDITKL